MQIGFVAAATCTLTVKLVVTDVLRADTTGVPIVNVLVVSQVTERDDPKLWSSHTLIRVPVAIEY